MTLIATPGAANADSFITLAFFKTYADGKGYDYSAFDDTDEIEPAIRRGTSYLSDGFTWGGARVAGRGQALAFPRSGLLDGEGWDVDHDSIPPEVQKATAEASWYELNNPGGLSPTVTMADRVKREKVGALEVEYVGTGGGPEASRPVLTILRDLIGGLLSSGASNLVGRAVRG